tara:strand:- start:401 stop:595 length:195 start_codon:yes stop_codon:yes gene_type:complete
MNWTDINEIAIQLADDYPDIDPKLILFTDLHQKVMNINNFEGEADRSNEKILEAIQAAWIDELD